MDNRPDAEPVRSRRSPVDAPQTRQPIARRVDFTGQVPSNDTVGRAKSIEKAIVALFSAQCERGFEVGRLSTRFARRKRAGAARAKLKNCVIGT